MNGRPLKLTTATETLWITDSKNTALLTKLGTNTGPRKPLAVCTGKAWHQHSENSSSSISNKQQSTLLPS